MSTGKLTISLDGISANWQALDQMSDQNVETAAVVKADGYGLDAAHVATALYHAGARTFFVAAAEEAAPVRQALGDDVNICVFSGHMRGDTDMIGDLGLIPMLNSIEQLTRHLESLPGHRFGVQLDTGMNRLGMEPGEWDAVRDLVLSQDPFLLISHLACADEPYHAMNASQLEVFKMMTDGLDVRRSLAATGGTILGDAYHFDMVRPGIGLYGGAPFTDATPVVHLTLPVVQTRELSDWETVGYGATWTAKDHAVIATVAAGYADGLIRAMGSNAQVWAGDVACPVAGRVSMDTISVDVSHLSHVPDSLDILCPYQGVDELAEAAGTIGYEILTSLGPRYGRRYINK